MLVVFILISLSNQYVIVLFRICRFGKRGRLTSIVSCQDSQNDFRVDHTSSRKPSFLADYGNTDESLSSFIVDRNDFNADIIVFIVHR